MRWRFILNILGVLLFFFGLTMIFPLVVALYYRDQSLNPLLESMAITVFAGLILYLIFRRARAEVINQREGMAIVAVVGLPWVCSEHCRFIWGMAILP